MERPSDQKSNNELVLGNGQVISMSPYLNFKLIYIHQDLKNIDVSKLERFRKLISNGKIIDEFKKDDYQNLTPTDLKIIANSFIEANGYRVIDNNDVFSSVYQLIEEEEDRLAESIKGLLNPIQDLKLIIKSLTEDLKPIYKISKKILEELAPFTSKLREINIRWSETINKFIIEYKEYLSVKEEASLIATKYDWFVAYDFYTNKNFYEELIELDKIGEEGDKVDNLFIEYYDYNLINNMIDDIRELELVGELDEILIQIKYGYEQNLFYLVVPTLFVMIGGIMARGFNHHGRMSGGKLKEYINRLISNHEINSLHQIINEKMLIQIEHGVEVASSISRHAIIHGGDINYGRETVALKLLLIFYNLVFAMGVHFKKSIKE